MNRFLRVLIAVFLIGTAGLVAEAVTASAQTAVAPRFSRLKLGEVMPSGWLQAQMERDLREGFAGHFDQVAPQWASTDIFGSGRNAPGKPNNGVVGGEGSAWWWGETEGNWRTGYIMMAYMSGDAESKRKADAYVTHILQTQDKDGYIGAYSPELRYSRHWANGELWTQTCILRGLLAYYELTGKMEVLNAVERAVRCTISKYGPGKMTVFGTAIPGGPGPNMGIGHDLMFVDVLERLYDLTGNAAYRDFGLWLYQDYQPADPVAPNDLSLVSLLDLQKPLIGHGPDTLEQFRVPLWAYFVSGSPDYKMASENAFIKIGRYLLPGGAVVSMEDIGGRSPDPTETYYEYCAMKELLATWISGLQKMGDAQLGDSIEKLAFNAAEGARSAGGKGINYCTRDNRYRVEKSNAKVGVRTRFSPKSTCCVPNATYIYPLYVWGMWMKTAEDGLAATLYGPSSVNTRVKGVEVQVEEKTDYPFSSVVSIAVSPERPVDFPLQLRNPAWSKATRVRCEGATVSREGDYFVIRKEWEKGDRVSLEFSESIEGIRAANDEIYLQRGPLVYALRIPEVARDIKDYSLPGFADLVYDPAQGAHWSYALDPSLGKGNFGFTARGEKDVNLLYPYDGAPVRLEGKLINLDTGRREDMQLIPMGSSLATLRRVTFPVGRH
jgi:DUF1680 family protein